VFVESERNVSIMDLIWRNSGPVGDFVSEYSKLF